MRYEIDGQILTDIADSIREKTGKSALIKAEDMAGEIEGLSSGNYELLEYIESNGTQAIDTGISPKVNENVHAIVTFDAYKQWSWPIGAGDNGKLVGYQYAGGGDERINIFNGGSSAWAWASGGWLGHARLFTITTSIDMTSNIGIFCAIINAAFETSTLSRNKFYSMRIGDHFFVPVRRVSDMRIGVLNTYTGEFLQDALGGDPFVTGPAIGMII